MPAPPTEQVGLHTIGRKVSHVHPWGPAFLSGCIEKGDEVLAVNDQPVGETDSAEDAIDREDLVGLRVVLKVQKHGAPPPPLLHTNPDST
jgi:S1-C subfamily serine protease